MLLGMHQAGHVGTHERRAAATRRSALTAAGLAVVGAGVLGASACSPQKSPQPSSPRLPDNALITLGVAAGPPPTPSRVGISSVLKIGRDLYVIDCGLGSLNAFTNAGLQFDDLKAMFITHLHTDHIVDYYNFFLSGGFLAPPGRAPVLVYGPGPAGVCRQVKSATRIQPPSTLPTRHRALPRPPKRCIERSLTPATSSSATTALTTLRTWLKSRRSGYHQDRTTATERQR